MDKNSTGYIIMYSVAMVIIVALALSIAATTLKDRQRANVESEMKGAILAVIGQGDEAAKAHNKAKYIEQEYDKYIVQSLVINLKGEVVEGVKAFELLKTLKAQYAVPVESRVLPLFVGINKKGQTKYIIPLWGSGLWGAVWGYMALNDDWTTICGVEFDHAGETPGLGAEISTPVFEHQFDGKSIRSGNQVVGLSVLKGAGSSKGNENAVDAISGGTITSRGVESMIKSNLSDYSAYIDAQLTKKQEAEQSDSNVSTDENGNTADSAIDICAEDDKNE